MFSLTRRRRLRETRGKRQEIKRTKTDENESSEGRSRDPVDEDEDKLKRGDGLDYRFSCIVLSN